MANLIGIVGESGSGKSTSIGFLNPTETVVVSVANKPLPIKGFQKKYTLFDGKTNPKGNLFNSSNVEQIRQFMQFISLRRPDIKNLIIDDKYQQI